MGGVAAGGRRAAPSPHGKMLPGLARAVLSKPYCAWRQLEDA